MTSLFVLHLLLAGLMGINSITTVSKVSVKAGASVIIPCLYDPYYREHVKYLCKGKKWSSCSYAVKTNLPDSSKKFLISDDPNQTIFTVTMKDLQKESISYWCAVERDGIILDVKQRFELAVTTGTPNLYVDQQEITAYEGGNVTVRCHCRNRKERKWCRLSHLRPYKCVSKPSGSIDGTTVTIDESAQNAFNVTMSGLKTGSSGWYWCGIENFQMPVHITVHALTSTTTTTTTTTTTPSTADIITTLPTTAQHPSLLTSAEPHTAQPTNSTINGTAGESQQDEDNSSTMVIILTTTLIFLLLIVLAAFLGWRMMRRYKTKPQRTDITAGSHTGSDPDVQYATISHKQHVADQQKQNEDSVTYSDIVLKDHVRQMAEPVDGSVIYSTVHSRKD